MNTNYEKDFVPYEQALALKELGFDEKCFGYFGVENELMVSVSWNSDFNLQRRNFISAPLFQQAFRWFREKHNIDAWVQPFVSEKQNGKPFLPDESYAYYIFEDGVYVADGVNFLDSEEAELECLKKLIEIVKQQL